jgi:hypothetical protein
MRTRINARRFASCPKRLTKVAGCRFCRRFGLSLPSCSGFHLNIHHIDISIRAILRTKATPDAPVLNHNFSGIPAPNGTHRTAHHAVRIKARATGTGHQKIIEPKTFANQSRHTSVSIRTGLSAFITSGTLRKIKHKKALRFLKPLLQKAVESP